MSLISITLAQLMRPEPVYLAMAAEAKRQFIEPVVSALYQPSTVQEISERIGLSSDSVRRHIRAMLKTGDVEECEPETIINAIGYRRNIPRYRIKNAR